MQLLKTERPDFATVVHDLAESAVHYAREEFGLPTILGDISALQNHDRRYDAVALSDVPYYEPRIADVWRVLSRLVAPGGAVIVRVPNKLAMIRMHPVLYRLMRSTRRHNLQDRIKYFNPEHIYILSRQYVTARLLRTGSAPSGHPSPFFAVATVSDASGHRRNLGAGLGRDQRTLKKDAGVESHHAGHWQPVSRREESMSSSAVTCRLTR